MIVIQTNGAPAAIGPYSQAFVSGNLVFTSGQIALVPESGAIVGLTIEEQTEQVISNLKAVLEAAGSSLDKVLKTTCFLADMNDFTAFNAVYAKHFSGKPARSTVAVRQLPKNALVEIEVIAELA
jgi:2-iminobutanoate/2-iminopropanoate deaminase